MAVSYNHIAGQSVERLAALSDGVFAVAMTLLVLDLRVPAMEAMHGERELWRALVALSPRLVMYMMSFMMLGIFWIGQQTQLNHLARSDRSLSWIHSCSCSRFRSYLSPPLFWPNFPSTAPHFSSSGEYSAFGEHVVLQLAVCVGNGTSQT
jgi:Endosomal/lysosomal potassium channel TMEM175